MQILLASVLILSCSLCTCIMAGAAATPSSRTIITPTAGATPRIVLAATVGVTPTDTPTISGPTATPTLKPTPSPTSSQTATPPEIPTQAPTPAPTQPPAPTPTPTQPTHTGVNGNPWGYDFNPGALIDNPPSDFCTAGYFNCIGNFWKGQGYVIECNDGRYSKSGGRTGSCSRHGGDGQVLYSH